MKESFDNRAQPNRIPPRIEEGASPYEILGVTVDASQAEIKAARDKLAKQFHPDTGVNGDVEKIQLINKAFEILGKPETRALYDSNHPPAPKAGPNSSANNDPSYPYDDIFKGVDDFNDLMAKIKGEPKI